MGLGPPVKHEKPTRARHAVPLRQNLNHSQGTACRALRYRPYENFSGQSRLSRLLPLIRVETSA